MSFEERLKEIERRIAQAAERVGRSPQDVTLVAVSKGQPVEALKNAYSAGVRVFGENYVQEWQEKAAQLPGDIQWHYIGHLQSNKARHLAEGPTACVHSLSSEPAIRKLARRREACGRGSLDVFLEVNLGEENKSGIAAELLEERISLIHSLPSLNLKGLMAIPPWGLPEEESREIFRGLKETLQTLQKNHPELEALSMGMSDDFEIAIEEGATHVRVGTALFGPRSYRST